MAYVSPLGPFPRSMVFTSGGRVRSSQGGTRKVRAPVRRYVRRAPVRRRANVRTSGFVGSSGENKFFDLAHAAYVNDTTGSITHLDVIPQGTTVNSRDGRKFSPTAVNIRGWQEQGSTAVWNNPVCLLVWDKQPNKALAAITDVLDSVHPTSQNKRESASRFTIIRRWDTVLTGKNDGSTVDGFAKNFDHYVKLPAGLIAECTPSDTTGAIGNRVSGALLFITLGGRAAGTTAAHTDVSIRVSFKDV